MAKDDRIRSRQRGHQDRKIEEVVHDPYRERYKPQEPAVCPECGVLFHQGRWLWKPRPENASEHLCPACHRIHDNFPAGYVTLSGPFLAEHRDEVIGLVKNEETRAKTEHPLERIMGVKDEDGTTVITTTELHIARRIGEALSHAWRGELEIKQSPDEYLIRVYWKR